MTTQQVETYFTRQEAIKLAKLSGTQLSYLDKLEIISPLKIGAKRPTCLYSWQQVIALRIYAKLREDCSLQTLREAIKYLKDYKPEDLIADKRLIVSQNKIFWIDGTESFDKVFLQITGSNKGQFVMPFTFKLSEVIEEVESEGKDNVMNFEERFKLATNAA